ncbi:uncharacterized protein MYCFIDRAFT_211317 [Pseudocercospora fijiensis CIRAD86]|uniref:Uncharacterized protein n=1 Tax=Pseudocercospora fijiensis (strain CIRAD86) TaxID=383855 RepID=M3B1X7_PSEFD|nr:uncharacterized protein MYCFIDRAFT_211317 [Pseudocercospora fijiensis CIRAD86]EME83373.1 hypothetical protein MYCFIDRAFT_211317 [Pseudocercospora fijiensis CIRAD86]
MSGVHGHVIGHLARRGYDAAQAYFHEVRVSAEQMAQLQQDAELYEQAGPAMEIKPYEMLPVLITAFLTILLVASIKYTLGEVVASLAMIESPTSTAIIEDKPPAYKYADEPDAPLEKEGLLPAEAEADKDVEITLIPNKPITSSIRATMGHVTRIGGFRAQWRGAGVSFIYHFMHSALVNLIAVFLGFSFLGHALVYVFVSVGLARIHMAWTHAMISQPSSKPFWRRLVARTQCKALLLPSFVFALAQQATFVLPMIVAFALGLPEINRDHVMEAAHKHDCSKLMFTGLRFLAVPATFLFVAFAVLLPATVTLTRIEALLLPEEHETIVPFDRQAIVGDVDMQARGSAKLIFMQAWRSFDRAARWRLIKLYVKMAFIQIGIIFISAHLMVAEVYIIGGERLGIFVKSAAAQLKLAAIEARQQ